MIPILSIMSTAAIYVHAYGKSPEDTYINLGFVFIVGGFIASCMIAFNLIAHFTMGNTQYLGIVFSLLACLVQFVIIGLYLVLLYDVLNP